MATKTFLVEYDGVKLEIEYDNLKALHPTTPVLLRFIEAIRILDEMLGVTGGLSEYRVRKTGASTYTIHLVSGVLVYDQSVDFSDGFDKDPLLVINTGTSAWRGAFYLQARETREKIELLLSSWGVTKIDYIW